MALQYRALFFRLFVLGCLLRALLAPSVLAASPVTIGILAERSDAEAEALWFPLRESLQQGLPDLDIRIEVLSAPALEQAVRARRLDFVLTNPAHHVLLRERIGLGAPLATAVRQLGCQPVEVMGGVIVVRAEREDLHTLQQLASARIAAPFPQSFGGNLLQQLAFADAGAPLPALKQWRWVGDAHVDALSVLLADEVDAAFLRADLFHTWAMADPPSAAQLRVINRQPLPDLPFVVSTRLMPEWPLAAMPFTDSMLARRITARLFTAELGSSPCGRQQLRAFTIPADYSVVEEALRALKAPPFEDFGQVTPAAIWRTYNDVIVAMLLATLCLLGLLLALLHSRQRLRDSLAELQVLAAVFSEADEGIIIGDASGRVVDVNAAFSRITGYAREELLGHSPTLLQSSQHNPGFYRRIWAELRATGSWSGEVWDKRKDGEIFPSRMSISSARDRSGRVLNYIALFSDISEEKRYQAQLERAANFDALTGLPNRALLADRLAQAMAQSSRRKTRMAVVYLDLDGFKAVNDTHGHAVGDQLLCMLAERLQASLREGDTVARLGGDELVLVLLDLNSREECEPLLHRFIDTIAQPVCVGSTQLRITASLGVTMHPQPEPVDADQLLRQADQAMYRAKLSGKHRFHFFDPEEQRLLIGQFRHYERIQQALETQELELFYQPKVNMRSGIVIGYEALLRWRHPERGLLSPAAFLSEVENEPLGDAIGEWVLHTVLAQLQQWLDAGLLTAVSINVSARQMQLGDMEARLRHALQRFPSVNPAALELEVLETSALEDVVGASRVMQACHALGVTFALDDFGTGYSSLTYLKRLPVNTLKIDQTFVRDMLEDPEDLAILNGVLGLCSAFDRTPIAEGVETAAHGEVLLDMGCELAQGYGIARPMPAQEVLAWQRRWRAPQSWRQRLRRSAAMRQLVIMGVEHTAWVARVILQLRGGALAPELDPARCQFGRWLQAEGERSYGAHPQFEPLKAAHAAMHARAGALLDVVATTESGTTVQAAIVEMEQRKDEFLRLLHALEAPLQG